MSDSTDLGATSAEALEGAERMAAALRAAGWRVEPSLTAGRSFATLSPGWSMLPESGIPASCPGRCDGPRTQGLLLHRLRRPPRKLP